MLHAVALRGFWARVLFAAGAATIAFALTRALDLEQLPFLLPMVGVLVSALYGGFAAGLLAGIMTIAFVTYAVVEPRGAFRWPSIADAYHLGMFAIVAAVISLLASRHRRAEATLQATLSSIADGVIVTDTAGRITFLNPVAEQLTGHGGARANARPVGDVFKIVDEATRQPLPNRVPGVLREDRPEPVAASAILIAQDGTERPITESVAVVRDTNDEAIGAVIVFRDASQQRSSERALREQATERERLLQREHAAREQAERANRIKDEFLATLSHELRTPLNAVIGWVHMLLVRPFAEDERTRALTAIQRNAIAQARLVDDILDLSRIVTGRMALELQPVDVCDVVRSAAESVTPAVLAKHQDLQLELRDGALISGDAQRLRQIVWNLLSNAAKFTPEGGTIHVGVVPVDGTVELTVRDTGQGIDPTFLPFIFDPFRQADGSTTRVHAGLGIGLALVRQLVEAHGGTVRALSDGPGQGTTVQVRLPAGTRVSVGRSQNLVMGPHR